MFVLRHHRGYGKEEMMKKLPDVVKSKEEYNFETPKFSSQRSGSRKSERGKRNSRRERRSL